MLIVEGIVDIFNAGQGFKIRTPLIGALRLVLVIAIAVDRKDLSAPVEYVATNNKV